MNSTDRARTAIPYQYAAVPVVATHVAASAVVPTAATTALAAAAPTAFLPPCPARHLRLERPRLLLPLALSRCSCPLLLPVAHAPCCCSASPAAHQTLGVSTCTSGIGRDAGLRTCTYAESSGVQRRAPCLLPISVADDAVEVEGSRRQNMMNGVATRCDMPCDARCEMCRAGVFGMGLGRKSNEGNTRAAQCARSRSTAPKSFSMQ